ncbi:hypothetical protein [Nesterenkonia sp. HG001]|uniref:hypothetical protein n=1 Tax=Nesterenkonia sp. HG001 TaxID=2983207 RepID=UPI002AC3D550|nr:hypothetical protein [Nesterenkonia sp. HG001]MDZ5076780.1 hypothetical protein [Nesterenkonia sp. HG001]
MGVTHTDLVARHRPAHVRRKMRLWAPLAAIGTSIYFFNFHDAGLALSGAAIATIGLLGLIGDQTSMDRSAL